MKSLTIKMVVYSIHHARGKLFGGQSIPPSDDLDISSRKSDYDIEIKRLSQSARLFGPIEDGDLFYGLRDGCYECFSGERTIQPDFYCPYFFAAFREIGYGFFDRFCGGSHGNDDLFCIRRTDVIKKFVLPADFRRKLIHVFLHDSRSDIIKFVHCFSALEINVRILGSYFDLGLFRIHGALTEFSHILHLQQFSHELVRNYFHLLNLIGCPESVKEMEERDL